MNVIKESVSTHDALKQCVLVEYNGMIQAELADIEKTVYIFASPEELLSSAREINLIDDFYEPDYRDEVFLNNGRCVSFRDWWDNIEWDDRQDIFKNLIRFWEEKNITPRIIVTVQKS